MLMETRQTFVPECKPIKDDMLFSDFLLQWLEIAKPTIAPVSYTHLFTGFLNRLSYRHKIEIKIVVSLVHKLTTLYPVSYTHLDVYKRQAQKQAQRKEAYELIDNTCAEMMTSGASFRQYLDVQGRFDRYAVANAILVLSLIHI